MYQLTWSDRTDWRALGAAGSLPAPPAEPAVSHAAALVWEEHCVECAVPSCYASCPLYVRRADAKCARFAYGIVANRGVRGLFGYGADVSFRRWGKLEAYWPGLPGLMPVGRLRMLSRIPDLVERAETWARRLPLPGDRSFALGERLRKRRKKLIRRRLAAGDANTPMADALLVRFYCPEGGPVARLQVEIDQETDQEKRNVVVFRRSFDVAPGWNEHRIPAAELPTTPGKIRVWPENDAELRLVFAWLDVVAFAAAPGDGAPSKPAVPAAKVKCVAWDLDGTLWQGLIGEEGPDRVVPRPEALELVRTLDSRGIVQTIASKNDHEVAWPKIEELGLADMFLYPAIHWGPKSGSLKRIAAELDINVDTFAFIDDTPFERAEVAAVLPQVRVFDAAEVATLASRPEFDVPVTEVSRARRQSYLAEAKRRRVEAVSEGGHEAFLRSCHMVLRIGPPRPDQQARCLELLQRSNQFNLSGARYSQDQFAALLADPQVDALAFDVSDDFGDYGLVGFAAARLDADGATLFDFVMSCRVARKGVEDAFLCWYAGALKAAGRRRLGIRLVHTERNAPLAEALAGTSLARTGSRIDGAVEELDFDLGGAVPEPGIVRIEAGAAG